ncbi:ROK family transcriptional regulator [Leifsonia poae]|uniref:ROK family transcriptional regulator n=1 Tax=Leifsonia poae TaxID=110933 RepID=UPI001CBF81B0
MASGGLRAGGDSSVLRRLNLQSVLRVLHQGGARTVTELASAAQISRPTAKQAIDDLVATQWITLVEHEAARPGKVIGRPAQAYEFRPDAGHVLGVDIGAHKAVALICNLKGEISARARHQLDPGWTSERRLRALDSVIEEALEHVPSGSEGIDDAVIATPGVVGIDGVVAHSPVIPGWEGQDLGAHVSERFGFPSRAANDIAMAALAEHWLGAAKDAGDVVYLHAGRRIGTALLIDGRPHRGHHGAATEIGLWRGLQWAPAYDRFLQFTHETKPDPGEAVERVFAAAAAGDAEAQHRIDDFAEDLAVGLAPIIVAVDPELLVIGGGMSAAGDAIADPVRERIDKETLFPPRVVCSILGDESVAIGSLRLALDRAEERLFTGLAPAGA